MMKHYERRCDHAFDSYNQLNEEYKVLKEQSQTCLSCSQLNENSHSSKKNQSSVSIVVSHSTEENHASMNEQHEKDFKNKKVIFKLQDKITKLEKEKIRTHQMDYYEQEELKLNWIDLDSILKSTTKCLCKYFCFTKKVYIDIHNMVLAAHFPSLFLGFLEHRTKSISCDQRFPTFSSLIFF